MHNKIFTLITAVIILASTAQAQFSQNWAAIYDNPNGGTVSTSSRDIKNDAAGNTYTVISTGDIVLVKYSNTGTRLWSRTYNGTGNAGDWPYEMGLDPSGNIYITGATQNAAGNADIVLLKYDPSGNLLWVRTFNGAFNGTDIGTGVYVSPTRNEVYVTGYTNVSVGVDYIITLEYDGSGNQLWYQVYPGAVHHDVGNDVIADANGNVYTVGTRQNNLSQTLGIVIKYNSAGVQQWAAGFTGTLGYADQAVAVALDPSNNIIVVGSFGSNTGTSIDIATAKYTPAGVRSWSKTITSLYINNDYGTDVLVDSAGNIYTLGYTNNGSTNSTYLQKYDPLGNELWGGNMGGNTPVEMEFDLFGNIIFCGTYSSGNEDVWVESVTPVTHVLNWLRTFSGTPAAYYDYCTGLSVDGSGNVHICGQSFNGSATLQEATTVTWDNSGNLWWSDFWGMTISTSYDLANDIAMDANNNVYVTGFTYNNGSTYEDYVTLKYNSSGVQQWATLANGTANSWDRGKAITVDGTGNVYVAGYISNSNGYKDYGTIKYNSAGVQQWRSIYTGTLTTAQDSATAIAVDASGNVYVTGMASNTGAAGDWATVKYNSAGVQQWAKTLNGTANNNDIAHAIYVDGSGNVYVCGSVQNTGFNNDYGIIKYDASGNQLWYRTYNGTMSLNDYAMAMAVDGGGNVYITGYAYNTGTVNDIVTVKYDASGTFQWAQSYNGSANSNDYGSSITLDASGNVIVCGTTASTGSGDDYVTIKYDASGNQLWAKVFNGPGNGNDKANSVKTDLSGKVYTTGYVLSQAQTLFYNYTTVIYDGNGVALDTLTYAPGSNATCSTVDPNGGVVVSGNSLVNSWRDIHTVSYCAAPSAGAGSDVSICLGGSTTLNASGGSTYLWTPATGLSSTTIANPVANPTSTTTYTVTVGNGACNGTATVTVTVTTSITVTATATNYEICNGGNTTLNAGGANNYIWNPGGLNGSSVSVSPTSTTTYTVTGTDLGSCTNTAMVTITVDQPPTVAAAGTDQNICINTASLAGNAPSFGTGSWSLVSGTATITTPSSPTSGLTGIGAGPNKLRWTISNGVCSPSNDTVVINLNSIPSQPGAISGATTVCSGTTNIYSITAVTGATSYTWTLPGGWTGTSTINSINATAGATGGDITVTANNACGNSIAQTLTVTVNTVPATPGSISGLTTICSGSSNTYSITPVGGATSYTWTLPGGWSGTSTTYSITTTASATSGNVSVTANNTCGSSSAQTLGVTVNTVPVTPGTISGSTIICSGSSNTYSITPVSGATSYTWTLPVGWSGTSTTYNITTTSNSTSGNVSVTANNTCGSSTAQSLGVTVNSIPAIPGTISGPATICSGSSNTYSITPVAGATSYTWTLPGGWTGSSSTYSITTTAGTSSGIISVTADNTCGSSTAQTLSVTVNTIPATPGTISGSTSICSGSTNIYSISTVSGATSYTWTLPGSWSGTSTINTITTTASTTSGNVTVTANNTCGSSLPQTLGITVNTVPATPGSISGNAAVCQGSNNTYSISSVPGAISYTWVLPSGWTGTSTNTSINTTASATSGNISVTANNTCGSSSPQIFAVSITPSPSTPGAISGNTAVCESSNNTYSITPVGGATSYTWTLPSGWFGSSVTASINTTAGSSGGNITVTANNACGVSGAQTLTVSVNAIPAIPGAISGNTDICQSSTNTYSIAPVLGATSYTWVLPSGWTGTSTNTSINATASALGGDITVTANNSCGYSSPQILTVTVSTSSPLTPGTISGNTNLCSGSNNTYSIAPVAGATSYSWILPSGWTGASSTTSISTTAGSSGGNIAVTANNACGSSFAQILPVTVSTTPLTPGSISGNSSVCSGNTNTYSVSPVSGATSYTWVLPSGWTGSSITNSINATASVTSGSITVTADNSCGTSAPQTLTVTVITIPVQPGTISGSANICAGSSNLYSITPVSGATSYTWTLPGGWSGTSTAYSITTTASATSGNVTVKANNTCGSSTAQTLSVTVTSVLSQPSVISGNAQFCAGCGVQPYSVLNDPGATSYTWTLPSGWSGSSATNSISTTPGTNGGTIIVVVNNTCGASPQQTLSVTVNQLPNVSIDLSQIDTLCINGTNVALPTGNPPGGIYSGVGVTAGVFSPSIAGLGTHSVIYTYTDGNSCTNTVNGNIFVDACLGFQNFSKEFSYVVYPNPFTGIVTMEITGNADIRVKLVVTDIAGRLMMQLNDCGSKAEIDLSALSSGAYILKLETPEGDGFTKLIKQ